MFLARRNCNGSVTALLVVVSRLVCCLRTVRAMPLFIMLAVLLSQSTGWADSRADSYCASDPHNAAKSDTASNPDAAGKGAAAGTTAILEGQVTNRYGAGEPDVTVTVHFLTEDGGKGEFVAAAQTDELGDFVITAPRRTRAKAVVTLAKHHYKDSVRQVAIGEGELPPFVAVQLEGSLTLAGTITDEITAQPVAGAGLTLVTGNGEWNASSDEDGRFVLTNVAPGDGRLEVDAKGYGREHISVGKVEGSADVVVKLGPERTICLRIVDERGTAIPRAVVDVYEQERNDLRSYLTGADGTVILHGTRLDSEVLMLRLTEENHVSRGPWDGRIELPDNEKESTHELVMERAGRISGKVTDARSGAALNGARVVTGESYHDFSPRDWSNYLGEFTVKGVARGEAAVTVHLAGYAPELFTVAVNAGETSALDIAMKPGAALSGRVVNENNEPVAGAFVETTSWRGMETLGLRSVTDEDGEFAFDNAPRDEFEIAVFAHRIAPVTRTISAEMVGNLEIVLPRAPASGGQVARTLLNTGDIAPDVTLRTISGKQIRISELRGRVVLIEFWATWCGPCIVEMPRFKKVHEKYSANERFELIGISLDHSERALRRFVEQNDVNWHQVFGDAGGADKAKQAFGVEGVPSSFLIAQDGRIISTDLHGNGLIAAVESALKKARPE